MALQGGGSAKAVSCTESKKTPGRIGMNSHYWDSDNCAGTNDDQDWNDNDVCYKEDQVVDGRVGTPDTYVEFECLGAANATAPADAPADTPRSNRRRIRVLA